MSRWFNAVALIFVLVQFLGTVALVVVYLKYNWLPFQ